MRTCFSLLGKASALCFLLMLLCRCSSDGYTLNVHFDDLDTGTVYLLKYTDRTYELVDSLNLKGGDGKLSGFLDHPALYGLSSSKATSKPLVFFMENAPMKVSVNESGKTILVTGSKEDALYREAQAAYEKDALDIRSFILSNPSSQVGPYMVMRNFAWSLDSGGLQGLLSALSNDLTGTLYVDQMLDLLSRKLMVEVGQMAPDFTLEDTSGNKVSLSDFKGKYVILDFWASWCPDCRRECPFIVEAAQNLSSKGVEVLCVSLDRNAQDWKAGIEKLGLGSFTHVGDMKEWNSPVVSLYALRWIPTTFLISPEGRILEVSTDENGFLEDVSKVFGLSLQPSE